MKRRTIYKCKIVRENTEKIIKNAYIIVLDNLSDNEIGNYAPDPKSGSIVMALQPGSYHVIIETDGYHDLETDIVVKGKSDFKDFQLHEFIVKPK